MLLRRYYPTDEYPWKEDLYKKYNNIIGPPLYDQYGEDMIIMKPDIAYSAKIRSKQQKRTMFQ